MKNASAWLFSAARGLEVLNTQLWDVNHVVREKPSWIYGFKWIYGIDYYGLWVQRTIPLNNMGWWTDWWPVTRAQCYVPKFGPRGIIGNYEKGGLCLIHVHWPHGFRDEAGYPPDPRNKDDNGVKVGNGPEMGAKDWQGRQRGRNSASWDGHSDWRSSYPSQSCFQEEVWWEKER